MKTVSPPVIKPPAAACRRARRKTDGSKGRSGRLIQGRSGTMHYRSHPSWPPTVTSFLSLSRFVQVLSPFFLPHSRVYMSARAPSAHTHPHTDGLVHAHARMCADIHTYSRAHTHTHRHTVYCLHKFRQLYPSPPPSTLSLSLSLSS